MAAPQCLTLKTKPGVQQKLIKKEKLLRAFGVIAMIPVPLMSTEPVIQLFFSLKNSYWEVGLRKKYLALNQLEQPIFIEKEISIHHSTKLCDNRCITDM